MSVIASDTYADTAWQGLTDHTPDMGGPIIKHPTAGGSFYTVGNRALCRTPGLNYYAAVPATADYLVEADIVLFSAVGSAGVVGRVDPGASTFYHAYINAGNAELVLAKWVNGSADNIESKFMTFTASAGGVVYRLGLEMIDDALNVYLNGVLEIDNDDPDITAKGFGGIRAGVISDTSTGKHIDHFLITDSSTAPVGRSYSFGPLGL